MRLVLALDTALITVMMLVSPLRAQGPAENQSGALDGVPLPGGVRAAAAAMGDRMAPDRAQFLLEVIRRAHQTPIGRRENPLQPLLAHLDLAGRQREATAPETLPLPLPAAVWIDAVFDGRTPEHGLAAAIVQSRGAALLYYGLLSLDDGTRAWLGGERELVRDLAQLYASAFVLAAPGVRVADAGVRVPGGKGAGPVWEALVGRRVTEPAAFVRALLTRDEGRLAYFFGALAQLTPSEIAFALGLESADPSARVESARRLYAVFGRLASGWHIESRVFVRPALDPALLASDLQTDEAGRPQVPGTERFWIAAFADADARIADGRTVAEGGRVDFSWLCERIFDGEAPEQRRRYQQVLFASRVAPHIEAATAREAVEAVRAAARYPALTATIERMRITDVAVFARAAHRAGQLSDVEDERDAVRALAQFQGTLALVARAASRGSLPAGSLADHVTSLSAIDLDERGHYAGRVMRWLDAHLRRRATASSTDHDTAGPVDGRLDGAIDDSVDRDLLDLVAGSAVAELQRVEWEGTQYRVDLMTAEATRLTRLLGEQPRPYLSSARALLTMADTLADARLTRQGLQREVAGLERVAHAVGWPDDESWRPSGAIERFTEAAAALERIARTASVNGASRLAPSLRVLADDLTARGLLELTYAAALGQADRAWFAAGDAASGHDFGRRFGGVVRRDIPWQLPKTGGDSGRDRYAVGSLLGLDVRLAQFSLVRLSSKPPPRRPTLHEEHRRVFVEGIALAEPAALTDDDRNAIVSAIRLGRERLGRVRTAVEATAIADEMRLSPARRSLLPWMVAHDPGRVAAFLSPSELLWLGLGAKSIDPRWQAWGASGESRLGCLCPQLVDRRPWEMFAGRWGTGIFASAFPDLNLRLAELLAALRMPASLLGPVLTSATLDFVNTVDSRDQDDRRALVEFVQALNVERVEQYLALLTTDGPLVPAGAAADTTVTKTGVPR